MRNILVTGGLGFVGRHLLEYLTTKDDQYYTNDVYVMDDLSGGKSLSKIKFYGHDLPTYGFLPLFASASPTHSFVLNNTIVRLCLDPVEVLRGSTLFNDIRFDEIYHLAATVGGRKNIDGDPLSISRNMGTDATLLHWALHKQKQARVLYASSSAAYPKGLQMGIRNEDLLLQEDDVNASYPVWDLPDQTYGLSKLVGERSVADAVAGGLSVGVVRPFAGYGPDQDDTYPLPAIAKRVLKGDDPVVVWGSGLQERGFVHISDVVEAMVLVCRGESQGTPYNICSGDGVNFTAIAKMLIALEGHRRPAVTPLSDMPAGVDRRVGDPTRIREKFGWKPKISLEEGLQQLLDHLR